MFSSLHDECFRKSKIILKSKKNLSPWIIIGVAKSPKRKQRLYEDYVKESLGRKVKQIIIKRTTAFLKVLNDYDLRNDYSNMANKPCNTKFGLEKKYRKK